MKFKEYKNGYLLTNEEHDKAVKHRHTWHEEGDKSHCECGAMKMLTKYGLRVYIAMSPERMARLLLV